MGPSVAEGPAQPATTGRSLGLDGARNARDIGGYSTADGGVVRFLERDRGRGTPHETVNADYLLSNTYRGADPEHPGLDGADQAWLDTAFDTAVATYGSFDAYVSDGLKLSEADVTQMKSRLLD